MGNGSTGTTTGTNGTTGSWSNGSTGSPPAGWRLVADLSNELGRSSRWLRSWVAENVPATLQGRFRRAEGGAPALFVDPAAVVQLQDHFGTGSTGSPPPEPPEGPTEQAPELPPEPPEVRDAGWRAALEAERARSAAAEGQADRLRHELDTLRVAADHLQLRADEAERGRHAAELRLEEVRGATWSWVAHVRGLAWWRRLRRLPDPPAALVAGERLLAKPEE